MTSSVQLALAYIDRSPQSAARVLAALPADEAADFIEKIPLGQAVNVIGQLQPLAAATIIQAVSDKAAAAIMKELDFNRACALVRQLGREEQIRLLEKLRFRTRKAIQKSLAFPPWTIGARMTSKIATLADTDTLASAVAMMKRQGPSEIDVVFVVNADQQLVGIVSSAVALRQPETMPLSSVMDQSYPAISAHARCAVVANHSLWSQYAFLPVANRRGQLIGAISRRVMVSRDLADEDAGGQEGASIIAPVFSTLGTASMGLARLVLTAPPRPEQAGKKHGN